MRPDGPTSGTDTVPQAARIQDCERRLFSDGEKIGIIEGIYSLLVRPKSLGAGLVLGDFFGLALGISSGFGTFVHMPIPLTLAWGWFFAGWLKGLVAGGIIGAVIVDV